MRSKTITTMLAAVFATFILSDAASAYYSPRMGRFLNRDPIEEHLDLNLYVAFLNNATSIIDAHGLWGNEIHYDATILWATAPDVRYKRKCATVIAAANKGVDSYFSTTCPMYWYGDFSYHFDTDSSGWVPVPGARALRTAEHLQRASQLLADTVTFAPWHRRIKPALKEIGKALHPLQDSDSHKSSHQAETPFKHAPRQTCMLWRLGLLRSAPLTELMCRQEEATNPNWQNPRRPDDVNLWPGDVIATMNNTKNLLSDLLRNEPLLRCYCGY